jgi:hypothetical protein
MAVENLGALFPTTLYDTILAVCVYKQFVSGVRLEMVFTNLGRLCERMYSEDMTPCHLAVNFGKVRFIFTTLFCRNAVWENVFSTIVKPITKIGVNNCRRKLDGLVMAVTIGLSMVDYKIMV